MVRSLDEKQHSKNFLARCIQLEHSYFEQKSHARCSKYDTRRSMEWMETCCRSFQNFWVYCLCTCSRPEGDKTRRQRRKNYFSLLFVINQKLISFTIPSLRKLLLVVMSFFMKKGSGHGTTMLLNNK